MTTILGPAEIKQEFINVMGPEVGELFADLWDEVTSLHLYWSEFVELYARGEDRVHLLNQSASGFFWIVEKILPDYPAHSSGDDGPVRMRLRPGAGVGEALGQAVELVAAVEAPGEAGKVALGVLGADVMAGAGERGLDVAQGRVHPAALAAPIAQASAVTDGAG